MKDYLKIAREQRKGPIQSGFEPYSKQLKLRPTRRIAISWEYFTMILPPDSAMGGLDRSCFVSLRKHISLKQLFPCMKKTISDKTLPGGAAVSSSSNRQDYL